MTIINETKPPLTPTELATRIPISESYVREWLIDVLKLKISEKKLIQSGGPLRQGAEEAPLMTSTGSKYSIRLAESSDLPLMAELLTSLSDNTRYLRFLSPLPAFSQERATTEAFTLWLDNSWPTLILLATMGEGEEEKVIGLGELHIDPQAPEQAEVALLVRDEWQSQGIGTVLVNRLITLARRRGLTLLFAETLAQNKAMRKLLAKLDMPLSFNYQSGTLRVEMELPGGIALA